MAVLIADDLHGTHTPYSPGNIEHRCLVFSCRFRFVRRAPIKFAIRTNVLTGLLAPACTIHNGVAPAPQTQLVSQENEYRMRPVQEYRTAPLLSS